jgi:DNA-binding Xre family transcriptional regulator
VAVDVLVTSHVRERREARHLSLVALASAADLKKSFLGNAETGMTDFRVSQLQRLAQVLECHPMDLITFPGFPWCPCRQSAHAEAPGEGQGHAPA